VVVSDPVTAALGGRRIALLSPHPDDIAYSCGGLVARRPAGVELHMLTVFGKSKWAVKRALRRRPPELTTAQRLAEDRAYCDAAGIHYTALELPDAGLAGFDDVTELRPCSDDARRAPAAAAIAAWCARLRPDHILAPAAIGGHVDHVIVRDAARALATSAAIAFYEDLPYAATLPLDALERGLRDAGLEPFLAVELGAALDAKLAAMRGYASQTDDENLERVRDHALRLGGGRAVERLWRRAQSDREVPLGPGGSGRIAS
jgi:LmbE family N-acetylglucosaminyl deacetylase